MDDETLEALIATYRNERKKAKKAIAAASIAARLLGREMRARGFDNGDIARRCNTGRSTVHNWLGAGSVTRKGKPKLAGARNG